MVRVGVLSLQGSFLEHVEMLREVGAEAVAVRRAADLGGLDGLVVPGGEPTALASLVRARGLEDSIRELVGSGVPTMGTGAGSVLLAKRVVGAGRAERAVLGLMDVAIVGSALGRRASSFVAELDLEGVGRVRAAFLRSPAIAEAWGSARVLAYADYPGLGRLGAAALQGSLLALTFHPELTRERRVYGFFLSMVKR